MSLSTVAPLGNLQSRVHLPGILRIKLNEGTGYGGSICMGDLLGDTGGGAPLLGDPEGYERKAMGTGIPLHMGSVGQPGVGSSTRDFGRWLKGSLEVECLTLCGSSVKRNWRESSLARGPEG